MELVRDFTKLGKSNVVLAGGKGASLGEMTGAGISVPPGFVILSTAFEKFLEETDLNVEINAALDSVNHKEIHTVESASEKIQALIIEAGMPKDIGDEIQKFFKKLDARYVAVRSSATAEDSASAAWAGQLESYLNTTEENLVENVKKCWASLFTPRAIFYRFEKDLHKQKISVAVVVQKMIGSEKSGIAFSVHPVTQDRNQLIIEAGFGLGEAIVSGQITPDSYVVEKQPRRIIDKNVQTQSRGLYRAQKGGNEWHDIPKEQGEKQVLSDKEIFELSDIILHIENHYGFPCDIEWAFEAGRFYIVQSRPITTLLGERTLVQKFLSLLGNDKIIIFEADFYPLLVLLDWLNYYDRDNAFKNIYPFFCFKKGHATKAYVSLTKYHYVPKLVFQMYLDGELDISRTNKVYKSLSKQIDALYNSYYERRLWNESDLSSALNQVYGDLQKLVALTLFLDTLDQQVIQEMLAERRIAVNLNKIWEVSQILDFISFDSKNAEEIIFTLQKNGKLEKLQHIFTNYTYVPLPKDVEEKIRQFNLEEEIKKLERNKKEVEKNKKEKNNRQKTLSADEQKVLKFIDWSSWLRDDRKALINKANVLFFNITSKLYEKWGLEQDFVPVSFVFEVLKGKDFNIKNRDKIRQRKDRLTLIYYGEDRYEEDPNQSEEEIKILDERFLLQNKPQDENVLKGEVASLGYAKGKVRIILKKSEFESFKDGEILVTGMTRPEFVPLMKKAAAIVTDEGGITSHAAIVSRELRKPCIIGTRVATQVLHNGDVVELNTNVGIVRILK